MDINYMWRSNINRIESKNQLMCYGHMNHMTDTRLSESTMKWHPLEKKEKEGN